MQRDAANRADQASGVEPGQRSVPHGRNHSLMEPSAGTEMPIEQHISSEKQQRPTQSSNSSETTPFRRSVGVSCDKLLICSPIDPFLPDCLSKVVIRHVPAMIARFEPMVEKDLVQVRSDNLLT
jgi:hypothetical protein